MPSRNYHELRWPFGGLHVGRSYHGQAHDTTVACLNVRNYDPRTGRSRGAQRAGLARYLDAQASGSGNQPIQDIISRTVVPAAGGTATLAARSKVNLCVSNGTVQSFDASTFSIVTAGTSALSNAAPVIFSAELWGNVFFADGVSQQNYNGTTMGAWTPTAGTFPSNGANYPRLLEMWRSRVVLSGVRGDDHNWFMSALGNAFDFDYSPAALTPTMAVAGNNSDAGKIGDIINCMIPYDDDTLIFGGDHSIWQMSGDPAEGGRIDEISDITGMCFGRPWCKTYDGSVFFVGTLGGIYRMSSGQPQRISSERIEKSLDVIDLNTTIVRCVYDDVTQGVHFFFTPLTYSTSNTTYHYFYDIRRDAFFRDQFGSEYHNPVSVYLLDGDSPSDRVVLLGGGDRRIRKISYTATADDANPINSYVWLGPIKLDEGRRAHFRDLIITLDDDSHEAYYEVYCAENAEAAYDHGQMYYSGVCVNGRNGPETRRASGHACYVKLGNREMSRTWSYENGMISVQASGLVGARAAR
jgi:hypothetical protein